MDVSVNAKTRAALLLARDLHCGARRRRASREESIHELLAFIRIENINIAL
jgi:hypothetical protein